MEKPKQKVNAKRFVEDYLAGIEDGHLMQTHGLTRSTLKKLLVMLVEKNFLSRADLRESHRSLMNVTPEIENGQLSGGIRKDRPDPRSLCPQCGADVGKNMLTCPECGHVLPGEDRWARAERKKTLFERIPPRVLGIVIAIGVGIGLFFLFTRIILPMSDTIGEKRADAIRHETRGKSPKKAAKDMVQAVTVKPVQYELNRLISEHILVSANEDYTVFVTAPGWARLSRVAKVNCLAGIRAAMEQSILTADFQLVAQGGQLLAKVKGSFIDLYDEPAVQSPADDEIQAAPDRAHENLEKTLENRTLDGLAR